MTEGSGAQLESGWMKRGDDVKSMDNYRFGDFVYQVLYDLRAEMAKNAENLKQRLEKLSTCRLSGSKPEILEKACPESSPEIGMPSSMGVVSDVCVEHPVTDGTICEDQSEPVEVVYKSEMLRTDASDTGTDESVPSGKIEKVLHLDLANDLDWSDWNNAMAGSMDSVDDAYAGGRPHRLLIASLSRPKDEDYYQSKETNASWKEMLIELEDAILPERGKNCFSRTRTDHRSWNVQCYQFGHVQGRYQYQPP